MGLDGWFFKGGSTWNRWASLGDFSKGGVHKTDGLRWVIFLHSTKPQSTGLKRRIGLKKFPLRSFVLCSILKWSSGTIFFSFKYGCADRVDIWNFAIMVFLHTANVRSTNASGSLLYSRMLCCLGTFCIPLIDWLIFLQSLVWSSNGWTKSGTFSDWHYQLKC